MSGAFHARISDLSIRAGPAGAGNASRFFTGRRGSSDSRTRKLTELSRPDDGARRVRSETPPSAHPRFRRSGRGSRSGSSVTRVRVGDRVTGLFAQNWQDGEPSAAKSRGSLGGDIDGMLAEYVVLPENGVVRFPAHLSYEEAATLPCAALTAWHALTAAFQVKPGDAVVIQGTGGVSVFALQFAKLAGARVLGTSSSDEKLERARQLSLDAGLNYKRQPKWATWVKEQT
ncbi:MAG TPA: NAD(P)-dependent alcohol dehydrogenase, partial [Acidobacteriaceae bacterium]|nr:NAD(P)-dependent alcohol dehydrogenase [Acidobacteriaceae bacterium]